MAGFSTDPLSDTVFEVPADYKAAPIENLIEAMIPAPAQVAAPAVAAPGPAPKTQDVPAPAAFKIGNGVSAPTVLSRRDPAYTEEARVAKIQGSISLSLVVDASGNPQNVQVVRSLDPGLDQKAIEAVREWKFQPGQKDGKPVAVQASVQVFFRLLDKPPGQQR